MSTFFPFYKTNQPHPISFYRTDYQLFSILSSYKYESQLFSTYPVYEHQRWPGFGEDTVYKSKLDYVVDINSFYVKRQMNQTFFKN